jgi:pyruvate,water dikinase
VKYLFKIAEGKGTITTHLTGEVILVDDPIEYIGKCKGKIVVVNMPSPDIIILMKEALAIIARSGGLTCHVALISRELGKPAIVGIGDSYSILTNGQKITIDINQERGIIYADKDIQQH